MRRLLVLATLATIAFAAALAFAPEASVPLVKRWFTVVLAFGAGAASLLAGAALERGDYLRSAWLANGASYIANALMGFAWFGDGDPPVIFALRTILVLVTNLLGVLSVWLFANAYARAGLELPGGRVRRTLVSVAALALSLALGGVAFVEAMVHVRDGDLTAIIDAISSAGDIVVFVLLAPIAMTALALRGGLLAWPWGFLLASNLAWLVFDAQASVGEYLPHGAWLVSWARVWMVAAASLASAAALAQRRIVRD